MDGVELFIINPNQFSPQIIQNPISINGDSRIELMAQHLTIGNDATSLQFSPHTAVCEIQSIAPTPSPTHDPTTIDEIDATNTPSEAPSIRPTLSPTYYLPIEWCTVLILSDTAYEITFKVSEYDTEHGTTPSFSKVKYVIEYGSPITLHSIIPNNANTELTDVIFTPSDVIFTQFRMTSKSRSTGEVYAEWTECTVLSPTPTSGPSDVPSDVPTPSPTLGDVGVFVYSDDESICEGKERCACSEDPQNYACVGSDYPSEPQIEDTQLLFMPASGVLMPVLLIGRYPYSLSHQVTIEWQFMYLNDTHEFNHRQRVITIICS
eukprot:231164_1